MNSIRKVFVVVISLLLVVGCNSDSNFSDVKVKDDGTYYLETTNKSINFEIKKIDNKVSYQVKDSAGNKVQVIEKDKDDYVVVIPQITEYGEFTIVVTEGVFKDSNIKDTKSVTVSTMSKTGKKSNKSDKEIVLDAINNTLEADSYTRIDVKYDSASKIDIKNNTHYYKSGGVEFYCTDDKNYYMEDSKWKYADSYITKEYDFEERELFKYLLKASSVVKNDDNSYSIKTNQKDLEDINIDLSAHVMMKYKASADLNAKIKIDNNYISSFYTDVTDLIEYGEDAGREKHILEYKLTDYNKSEVIIPEEAIKTAKLGCDSSVEPC